MKNPSPPRRSWGRKLSHLASFHAITVAVLRRDDYSSALMRRLVISRTAARITRMEPPMYRMVVPMPPVEGPIWFLLVYSYTWVTYS